MSFSSEVKEELSKINSLQDKSKVQAELIGYLISSNTIIKSDQIKYATESEYNINRFSKLLNNLQILNYDIEIQGKIFLITFNKADVKEIVEIKNEKIYIKNTQNDNEKMKALSRGLFLGSGSMNNPKRKYHLEVSLSNIVNSEFIIKEMENSEIKFKQIKLKNDYCLYIKEGEEISKFLAFIGANKAVLKFEEIRVERDVNNRVNRLVNCETANLNKTINTSVTQTQAIKYLQQMKAFDKLDDSLKEIAIVRLEHPNSTLAELGKYLKEPIGKSGVNYRLKKIVQIAEELKNI